jgi:two-component system response regulator RegA
MLGDMSERIRGENDPKPLLLVEDDAPLRRNLVRSLEKVGFAVSAVGTLREAHEQAADSPPDYAVLDLNLSDGHGMELVHTLLDLRPGTRIVILTGYDSIASSLVALKAGAVDYLAKPASADQIVSALLGAENVRAGEGMEIPMSADRIRWEHIQRVFEQCNRNVSETARRLEMHRRTLQRILSKRAPKS